MDKKEYTYNLFEFQAMYGTEAQYESALFQQKWKDGFQCPVCGHKYCYTIKTRRLGLCQCMDCGHQTSVIKGIIMENSKLPLVKWFLALYFIAQNKDGISMVSLSKYTGVTRKTAWILLNKVRKAVGERGKLYKIGGNIEMDGVFFGGKNRVPRGGGAPARKRLRLPCR